MVLQEHNNSSEAIIMVRNLALTKKAVYLIVYPAYKVFNKKGRIPMKKAMLLIMAVWAAFSASAVIQAQNTPAESSGRSMEEVREKIGEVKITVENCYELLLADEPELSGDIEVSFSITPEGAVSDVAIVCSEGLEGLEEPVAETVCGLVFEPCSSQSEDLPVTVPFSLFPPRGE